MVGVVALVAGLMTGCDSEIRGSGTLKEETHEVMDFTQVQVAHGVKAQVSVGPKLVVIRGDDNLIGMIRPFVVNNRLEFRVDQTFNVRPVNPITMVIQAPELTWVGASGGSAVEVSLESAKAIDLEADGGSTIRAMGVAADSLGLKASEGSTVEVSGRAKQVKVAMDGGSSIRAKGLDAEAVEVSGSGGARGELRASESVTGDLSDGSTLRVSGEPKTRAVNDSGGSRVSYEK
jgi:hypothetical protein